MLKKIVKQHAPAWLQDKLKPLWNNYKESKFQGQGTIQYPFHGFTLDLPDGHPLPGLMAAQPYRDLCVGMVAEMVSRKYPAATMIDIGANVGDTAALIAHHCGNPLVLVEGSDFFFKFLSLNAAKLKNSCQLRKVLISDGKAISGTLHHWGGTAELKESTDGTVTETVALGDLTPERVCFVKSDTDGHDYKILRSGIGWLGEQKPALLFESQVRNEADLAESHALIDDLLQAGYRHFMVWDAAGYHMISTSDAEVIHGIHRYLLKSQEGAGNGACNLDLACFHADDTDIFEASVKWWANY